MANPKEGLYIRGDHPRQYDGYLISARQIGEVCSYGERAGGDHARGIEGWEGCVPIGIGELPDIRGLNISQISRPRRVRGRILEKCGTSRRVRGRILEKYGARVGCAVESWRNIGPRAGCVVESWRNTGLTSGARSNLGEMRRFSPGVRSDFVKTIVPGLIKICTFAQK